MSININYEGSEYLLDVEEMTNQQARVMKTRFGVPNLKSFAIGLNDGDVDAVAFAWYLARVQNGESGDGDKGLKPVKFLAALRGASVVDEPKVEDSE